MDSVRSVHHVRRSSKDVAITKRRNKKQQQLQQQVKVVYISNPVHFKASASEFKGLVQQFTGQDSDVAELSKFAGAGADDVASADRASSSSTDDVDSAASLSRPAVSGAPLQQQQQPQEEPYGWAGLPPAPFDAFDEIFTPRALESLAAFLPTSLYY